jgi:hypothetical protein
MTLCLAANGQELGVLWGSTRRGYSFLLAPVKGFWGSEMLTWGLKFAQEADSEEPGWLPLWKTQSRLGMSLVLGHMVTRWNIRRWRHRQNQLHGHHSLYVSFETQWEVIKNSVSHSLTSRCQSLIKFTLCLLTSEKCIEKGQDFSLCVKFQAKVESNTFKSKMFTEQL